MLNKILKSLYFKVFINVIVEHSNTTVYTQIYSKKGEISHEEMTFPSAKFTQELYEYIANFTKESPFHYVSFLDSSKDQGALPTCDKNKLSYYQDLTTAEYKCINKQFSIYTSKTDLYNLERRYEDIGIDFIFSPFIVLGNFFKDKTASTMAMYVLIGETAISVAVFENSDLLFAKHLDLELDTPTQNLDLEELDEDEKEIDLELEDESGIILDDIDVDGDLEDFSDIADLDNLEDIDEFSETKDLNEELYEDSVHSVDEIASEDENSHFNEDYQRFSLIQNAINNFYTDPKYEGNFLENIYIADNVGVSNDLRRYLEEEMFLNVYIRKIDVASEICDLAKEEIGL